MVTYRLAEFCRTVVGTDKEGAILEEAKKKAPANCTFIEAPAEVLPFPNNSFDLITVAQAFHWFDQQAAIKEFKRVARQGALVAIFRKRAKDGARILRDFVWEVLIQYVDLSTMQRTQDDFSSLRQAGFASCERIEFPHNEHYSPDEYLGFIRTHSTFNLIPEEKRSAYLNDIRQAMVSHLEKGDIIVQGIVELWLLQM